MWLIMLCTAALAGVVLGDLYLLDPPRLGLGALLALLGAGLAWRRPGWRGLALATLGLALGGFRASLVPADDSAALDAYLGLSVRLTGEVIQSPTSGPASTQLQLRVLGIGAAGRAPLATAEPDAGAIHVRVVGAPAAFQAVASGETLVLEGRLAPSDRPAPPTLLFPRLLERQAAPALAPSARLDGLRAATRAAIERWLPEPQASLSAGVLLGGAGHLDQDLRLELQRSGLAHVLAVDGFKQVLVSGVLAGLAVPLAGARAGALFVLLGVGGYTLLTGAHPAAVRAGLMVGLATLAGLTGRVADPLTSVVVAATVMAVVDPRILLDVGMQLSLSATLGIVLLWPRLRPRLQHLPRWVAEPVGLTLAVSLATLPVTLSAFQLVSLVSPLAHVVAVPLLPLVLLSAAALALVAPFPSLAAVVAWLAWLAATILVDIVQLFGSLPGAALATGRLPPLGAAGLAGGLLVWGVMGLPEAAGLRQRLGAWLSVVGQASERAQPARPADEAERRLINAGALPAAGACVAACAVAAGLAQLIRPDGRLHVHHLAQARGEAVFVRGPTGRTLLLVDGRLDGARLASQVAECLAVWEHRLDVVLQVDPEAQAGLGVLLARYPADERLDATADARLELGGGAVLDVHALGARAAPGASISFGQVWLPLVGRPPPALAGSRLRPAQDPTAADDLVSDGLEVWPDLR